MTVTEAAEGLAVSRNTLPTLLNGRIGISPELAVRLSRAFGDSTERWQQQLQYDLRRIHQNRDAVSIRRFAAALEQPDDRSSSHLISD